MINKAVIESGLRKIANKMAENRDYLIKLDQRNGDGDLGISMSVGFKAAYEAIKESKDADLGRALLSASKAFNNAAPSSLGTILSIGFMGMAKSLKGKEETDLYDLSVAMESGLENIMKKAESKPGEKTILDSLHPAIMAMKKGSEQGLTSEEVLQHAKKAAEDGAESTKDMKAVHGRAAYFAESSLGIVDGGAIAGKLIFEALTE